MLPIQSSALRAPISAGAFRAIPPRIVSTVCKAITKMGLVAVLSVPRIVPIVSMGRIALSAIMGFILRLGFAPPVLSRGVCRVIAPTTALTVLSPCGKMLVRVPFAPRLVSNARPVAQHVRAALLATTIQEPVAHHALGY
jgi:hypothetical protein